MNTCCWRAVGSRPAWSYAGQCLVDGRLQWLWVMMISLSTSAFLQRAVYCVVDRLITDRVAVCGPGQSPPLIPHFPTSLLSAYYFGIFYFFLSYSLCPFSSFSISLHSTRIAPLRFQAGCRRRRLILALVFMCWFCVICILDTCLFLSYLVKFWRAVW